MKKFLLTFIILFIPFQALADVVYLKNGAQVRGRVTEQGDYIVSIEVDGNIYRYYKYEIQRVEIEKQELKPKKEFLVDEELTEEKKALVRRLLEANGVRENIARMFEQVVQESPEPSRARLRQILDTGEVIELIIPLYAQYFTSEELKILVEHYRSATGSKLLKLTPQILEETIKVVGGYFADQGKKIK